MRSCLRISRSSVIALFLLASCGPGGQENPPTGSQTAGQTTLAAGGSHSLYVKPDGTVWAWGDNGYGQLGSGSTDPSNVPQQVPGLTDAVEVAAGGGHSLALSRGGLVYSWGFGVYGQLGTGAAPGSSTNAPVSVPGLDDVVAIAAGESHSVALKRNGTVWTWGSNFAGQLGNGVFGGNSLVPVQVEALNRVAAVDAGSAVTIALREDGTVWCWGFGFGTSGLPLHISGLPPVREIAALGSSGVALALDGSVWVWSDTSEGARIGAAGKNVPVAVPGLTGVVQISANGPTILARKSDGTVWAWGAVPRRLGPVLVQVPFPAGAPAVDIRAGAGHHLARRADGSLWAWGSNSKGQLGTGVTHQKVASTPSLVSSALGMNTAKSLTANRGYSAALAPDGTVWSWGGFDPVRYMGPTTFTASVPSPVTAVAGSKAVAAGGFQTVVLRDDGTVWVWGQTGSTYASPFLYSEPTALAIPVQVTSIASGWEHSLAIDSSGRVWAWGRNSYGSLGNGVLFNGSGLFEVPGVAIVQSGDDLQGIKAVAAGNSHSMALDNDGNVWTWGYGGFGELGLGDGVQQSAVAAKVLGLPPIQAISAGMGFCLALDANGKIWAWGRGGAGQLGNGTTPAFTSIPVQVSTATGLDVAARISAGHTHAMAVRADGSVWQWGESAGSSPAPVAGLLVDPAVPGSVAAGDRHSLVRTVTGTVLGWGRNDDDQLGLGDQGWVPQAVVGF